MPGTVHDSSAFHIRSLWKADQTVQVSDEIELKVIQSTGAIPTHFGVTVFSSRLYSCNFVQEHWIDLELLPIDSSAYLSPRSSEFESVSLTILPNRPF